MLPVRSIRRIAIEITAAGTDADTEDHRQQRAQHHHADRELGELRGRGDVRLDLGAGL
jgi:hypothetical protein